MVLFNKFKKEVDQQDMKYVPRHIDYFGENPDNYSSDLIKTKYDLQTKTFNLQSNAEIDIRLLQGDGDHIIAQADSTSTIPVEEQTVGKDWQEMYARKVAELKPEHVDISMDVDKGGYNKEIVEAIIATGATVKNVLDSVRVLIVDKKHLVAWSRVGNKGAEKQVGSQQSESESITIAYYMKRDEKRNEEVFEAFEDYLSDLNKRSEPAEVALERIKKSREFEAKQVI
jgi:hypothetical protein